MSRKKLKEQSASTNTEQQERSGILFTEEEGHSLKLNSEKVKREKIDGTPFEAVIADKGEEQRVTFIALGRFRLSEDIELGKELTEENVMDYWEATVKREMWDFMLKMLGILIPAEVTAQIAYRDQHNEGQYKKGFDAGTEEAIERIAKKEQ